MNNTGHVTFEHENEAARKDSGNFTNKLNQTYMINQDGVILTKVCRRRARCEERYFTNSWKSLFLCERRNVDFSISC